jgi:hypothetical protein
MRDPESGLSALPRSRKISALLKATPERLFSLLRHIFLANVKRSPPSAADVIESIQLCRHPQRDL